VIFLLSAPVEGEVEEASIFHIQKVGNVTRVVSDVHSIIIEYLTPTYKSFMTMVRGYYII